MTPYEITLRMGVLKQLMIRNVTTGTEARCRHGMSAYAKDPRACEWCLIGGLNLLDIDDEVRDQLRSIGGCRFLAVVHDRDPSATPGLIQAWIDKYGVKKP